MEPIQQQALNILAIDESLRSQLRDALDVAGIIDIFPPNNYGEVFARSREVANPSSPYVELYGPPGKLNDVNRIQVSIKSQHEITALLVREDRGWRVLPESINYLSLG